MKIRLLTLVLTLWLCTPAWADKALVVGVDHYPDLRGEARLSGGANDARLMAEKLGEMGFEVVLLT
ncbi:MAG TPA: caspase family protein, partial [Candidatus Nitrosotenuis sp.]|nr:caspase family protein [Candidatus Nitrosotenuis sp.]